MLASTQGFIIIRGPPGEEKGGWVGGSGRVSLAGGVPPGGVDNSFYNLIKMLFLAFFAISGIFWEN